MKDRIDHIVLFQLGWLGDSVMTVPAMGMVRSRFKNARIIRVINEKMGDFFKGCPYVDEIIPFCREARKSREGMKLLMLIRNKSPDMFLNLHTPDFDRPFRHYMRDALFAYGTGAGVRGAYSLSVDSLFLTHPVSHTVFGEERMDREMARVIPDEFRADFPGECEFWLSAREREESEALLSHNLKESAISEGQGYFCLSPFGKRRSKEWSYEHMASLCRRFRDARGWIPVVLGGRADREKMDRFISHMDAPFVDLVGKTGIKDAGAILEKGKVLLTIDSGLMHLASLVGTPVVAVFGPGNPLRWHPLTRGPVRLFSGGGDCSPCYLDECMDTTCFENIDRDEILDAMTALSGGTGRQP